MSKKRKIEKGFVISAAFFALMSLSVVVMALSGVLPKNARQGGSVTGGVLFWIGLLGGIVSYIITYKNNSEAIRGRRPENRRPVFLRFFSNPAAKGADGMLILGVLLNIVSFLWFQSVVWLGWIAIWILLTSVYAHFLLNGDVFSYIIHSTRRENNDGTE